MTKPTRQSGMLPSSLVKSVWRASLLASVSVLFVAGPSEPAGAQFFQFFQPRPVPQSRVEPQDTRSRQDTRTRRSNRSEATQARKKDVPIKHPFGENLPKGPLQLVVSLGDQRAVLYSNGIRVADTKISSGVPQHPTPTGIFSIIQKNRWHRSNIYSNAPMFYMHRLTWSGIALHEGHLPGYAASHGCIRMPTDFVSRLWNISKLGMRVIVARVEVTPQEFTHAKLFNPAQKPADTSRTSQVPDVLRPSLDAAAHGLRQVAEAQPVAGNSPIVSDAPNVASAEDADTANRYKIADAEEPVIVVSPMTSAAMDTAAAPMPDANETTATVVEPAAGQAESADAAPPTPTQAAAAPEPERPAIDSDELRLPRPAPLRKRAAEPPKLNGQVAVFISGKEKRIFVRHAFVPLFDMPIEIENPSQPLGTHTFTALELADGGARMRWNLVSMPLTAAQPVGRAGSKNAPKQQRKNLRGAVVTSESSTATDALDRITIPPEASERIAELLTPGSSLIITDEGLGRETGRYTEFIVETR